MYETIVLAVAKLVMYYLEKAKREDEAKDNFILHAERYTGVDLVSAFYADQELVRMLEKRKQFREKNGD